MSESIISNDNKIYKIVKHNVVSITSNTTKKKQDKNLKRILCRNMIKNGTCEYGSKCKYAHSLSEQIIDVSRKQAWNIIFSSDDLSDIDLQKNYSLYQTLNELTNTCQQCNSHDCIGGYNCDHGTFDKKYQICKHDLNYGNCKNTKCGIHLTDRGLKPWFNKQCELDNNLYKIKGTLLSENFFTNVSVNDDETLSNFTNSVDENDDYENDCDKSIFSK